MNHKLVAMVLSSVLLLSVLGGTGTVGALQAGNQAGNQATVTVSGSGQVTAQPDRAVVQVTAVERGPNASQAVNDLTSETEGLREALDDETAVESVVTTGYEVSQADQGGGAYIASQTFTITINDTEAVGTVVSVAVDNGADEVGDIDPVLSEERRQELRGDAIDAAVQTARADADRAASAAGLEIDSVRSVVVGPDQVVSATNASTSTTTVAVSVKVTYNATKQ